MIVTTVDNAADASIRINESGLTVPECESAIELWACQQGDIAAVDARATPAKYDDQDTMHAISQLFDVFGNNPEIFAKLLINPRSIFFKVVRTWDDLDASHPVGLLDAITYCRGETARMKRYESIIHPQGPETHNCLTIHPSELDYMDDGTGAMYKHFDD